MLLSARASAIQRHKQVVVWIDGKSRRIICWADDNANYVQDSGEPTSAARKGTPVDFPARVRIEFRLAY